MLQVKADSRGSSSKSSMQKGDDGGATSIAVRPGCWGLETLANTSFSFKVMRFACVFSLLPLLQLLPSLMAVVRARRRYSLEYTGACTTEAMAQRISC